MMVRVVNAVSARKLAKKMSQSGKGFAFVCVTALTRRGILALFATRTLADAERICGPPGKREAV